MKKNILGLLLAAALGASAASTFDVSNSGGTFTITRSGDTSAAETVRYRTVPLTAFPGQHFTATNGVLTFAAGQTSTNIAVSESAPSTDAFKYQTGTTRNYRFEVLDPNGFRLVSRNRTVSDGLAQFSGSYVNGGVTDLVYFTSGGSITSGTGNKYLDVSHPSNSWVQVTDAGYKQAVHTIFTDDLYGGNSGLRTHLGNLGYKMYATVYFTQKEEQDGYQYIQICSGALYDGDDPDGKVNDPANSLYKACFILSYANSGSVISDAHYQFFPHRYDYVDKAKENAAGITRYEFDSGDSHLYQQKFKATSYQADTSGSLVLPTSTTRINVRFDAAGSGGDNWDFKNLKARLALVDATRPIKLADAAVAPGAHAVGNTVYVSVPFNEIVTVTGKPTLSTTWGTLAYVAGSGSNVLTFEGRIEAKPGTALKVNSLSGTVKDLVGNALSVPLSINATYPSCIASAPWSGAGTALDPYLILSTNQLDALSTIVGLDEHYADTHFSLGADLAYPHATAWNDASSTESNYTPIGGYSKSFQGHFHGNGHTVSGIRIYRSGNTLDQGDSSLGLFGYPSGGTIRDVIVADANISGYANCGAIAGFNSATLTNCLALNVRVAGRSSYVGAVAGRHNTDASKLQFNHYRDCTANGASVGVGVNTNDVAGARSVHTLALADGVSVTSAESVQIADLTCYAANTPVTIACTPPAGHLLRTCALNGIPFAGDTFTMPADDSSVTATWFIPFDGSGTAEAPYLISTTNDLNILAAIVNGGSTNYANTYFLQTTNLIYDATTNNYTPVGSFSRSFRGTYDGGGHVVRGINVTRTGNSNSDSRLGLFGYVDDGIVRNVVLADSTFVGNWAVGGIVGFLDYRNVAIISNCCVASSVVIGAGHECAIAHGGIVGENSFGTIVGCLSAASVTTNSYALCSKNGGIVGTLSGRATVKDCLYVGTAVEANSYKGAIAGYNEFDACSFTNNYYTSANVPGGVGGVDVDGARRAHTITLGPGVSLVGEETVYDVSGLTAIGDGALALFGEGVTNLYSGEGQTIALAYNGVVPDGYAFASYTVNGSAIYGNSFTMPDADVAVAAIFTPITYSISCNLAGGVVAAENPATYTVTNATFTLVNPTRKYFSFAGWTGTGLDEPTNEVTIATGSTGNRIYTANWNLSPTWSGSGTAQDPYLIASTNDLNDLAVLVNGGATNFYGMCFLQTTNLIYDATTNNYTPVGGFNSVFSGIYDGGGHVVSGINIERTGDSWDDEKLGLFGNVDNGTVRNVVLENSVIAGHGTVGGIVGFLYYGGVSNCCVGSGVTIGAGSDRANSLGGIAGYCTCGTIAGCFSAASITTNGYGSCNYFAGIVGGLLVGMVKDCLYSGTVVEAADGVGAIAGLSIMGSFDNNLYTGAGVPGGLDGSDVDGARRAHTITLGEGVSIAGEEKFYDVSDLTAIGNSALVANFSGATNIYSGAGQTVTLAFNGVIPEGKRFGGYVVNGVAIDGDTFAMPDADTTVTVSFLSPWEGLQAEVNEANGGRVVLNRDYVITNVFESTLIVTNAVTLDLNGHTLDARGRFGVVEILPGGHLTLTNSVPETGSIIGGNATYGGGVHVHDGGAFTMAGGEISGNCARYGGGVYVASGGAFTVSGSLVVSGNTNLGGAANNVHLPSGSFISVSNLTAGASIGVTTETAPTDGHPAVFTVGATLGDIPCFSSDVPGFFFGMSNGELCLMATQPTPWEWLQWRIDEGGVVTLTNDVSATKDDATLSVTNNVVLDLAGHSITGSEEWGTFDPELGADSEKRSVIYVDAGGHLTLTNSQPSTLNSQPATITGGNAEYGGGVYVASDGTFSMYGGNVISNAASCGGGVYVASDGVFSMYGGNVISNEARRGGGVYMVEGGRFEMSGGEISGNSKCGVYVDRHGVFMMSGGEISGNTADSGGGVYVARYGRFEMDDGMISGNCATNFEYYYTTMAFGGGVFVGQDGAFTMNGGEISGNTADSGGGVAVSDSCSMFTMNGGAISGNSAKYGGGGYVDHEGTFTMSGGEISGNSATNKGGGVYVASVAMFEMSGGEISGNSAPDDVGNSGGGGVYMDYYGIFSVSGSPVVSGNTNSTCSANNVYLQQGTTIVVSSNLTAGASIGVTIMGLSISIPITFGAAAGDSQYFFSDDPLRFSGEDGEVCLQRPATPWDLLQAQICAGGVVTLTNDVVGTYVDENSLRVTNAVMLDLAGHSIVGNGSNSVIFVDAGGNLTLTNSIPETGAITGGNSHSGGGVYVYNGGTFTMLGGTISGNHATYSGGGVYVNGNNVNSGDVSRFTMAGGVITGNTASYSGGGGVCVVDGGKFTVSGCPIVSGNVNSVGAADNVYLSDGNPVEVGNLTAGASIGVATSLLPVDGHPAVFATDVATGDEAYFTSDDPRFLIDRDAGSRQLVFTFIPVSYIDADGNAQLRSDHYALIQGSDDDVCLWDSDLWYVVTGDVTINGTLYLSESANLIICDGATLTVTNAYARAIYADTLTIYGQTNNTGIVTATATGGSGCGIYANYDITVNGGNVTATGDEDGAGISSDSGQITINGGNVIANGSTGIASDAIAINWKNLSDSIFAGGYSTSSGNIAVNGMFTDGTNVYQGRASASDLAGKTLRPYLSNPPFPSYLDGADDQVKTNYVSWTMRNGYDVNSEHEAAFLLGISPATAIPAGAAMLKVVDFQVTENGYRFELASDVCDLYHPDGDEALLCNGYAAVKIAANLSEFSRNAGSSQNAKGGAKIMYDPVVEVEKITLPVPVTIDAATGHAVIDLDISSYQNRNQKIVRPPSDSFTLPPPPLFFRVLLTPIKPDYEQEILDAAGR